MSARRVLITGAGGFLGRAVEDVFWKAGWETVPAVRRGPAPSGGVILDFDAKGWPDAAASLPPCSAIVHLAGPVDLSATADPALFRSTSADGVARLAEFSRAWKARLVIASSVSVYGPASRIDDTTPIDPRVPYARAKVAAEEAAERSGVSWTALRLHGLFGASGPAHLGLNRSIEAALRGEAPVLAGDGEGRRNYAYVRDAAEAARACVENGLDGIRRVAGRETLSVRAMVEATASTLGDGRVERRPGSPSADLVMALSAGLPPGRLFRDALLDIKSRVERRSAC